MTRVLVFDSKGEFLMSAYIPDNRPEIVVFREGGSVYVYRDPSIELIKAFAINRLK